MHQFVLQQGEIYAKIEKSETYSNLMMNLITMISSLTITAHKTYISYAPIAVVPGSFVFVPAL